MSLEDLRIIKIVLYLHLKKDRDTPQGLLHNQDAAG